MKNLNELEESKGVVLFAYNSDTVDYVTIADRAAKLIDKFLKLPITLITERNSSPKFNYDKIVLIENTDQNFRQSNGNLVKWRNKGRCHAYDLSPYDCTLLLDTDYLVLTDNLLKLLDCKFDYTLMHNSHGVNGPIFKRMRGRYSLPFVWATVVAFRKTTNAKIYFDLIKRIEKNYAYYKTLFNCDGSYRNDYAFAIADIILSGYTIDTAKNIPWSMFTVENTILSASIKNNLIVFKDKNNAVVVGKQDVHLMDKDYLLSENFLELLESLTNE